jgi:hypothetical protein
MMLESQTAFVGARNRSTKQIACHRDLLKFTGMDSMVTGEVKLYRLLGLPFREDILEPFVKADFTASITDQSIGRRTCCIGITVLGLSSTFISKEFRSAVPSKLSKLYIIHCIMSCTGDSISTLGDATGYQLLSLAYHALL